MKINIRFAKENDLFFIEKFFEKINKNQSRNFSENFKKILQFPYQFVLISEQENNLISFLCFTIYNSIYSKNKILIYDYCFDQSSQASVKSMFLLLSKIDEISAKYDCEINILKNQNENSFTNSIFLQNNFKKSECYFK